MHVLQDETLICAVSLCFSYLRWESLIDISITEPEAEATL